MKTICGWRRPLFGLGLVMMLLFGLAACGGGGGGGGSVPHPVRVDLTVALQGAATVGAVDLDLTLADHFTPAVDGSGQPSSAALTKLLATTTLAVNYTAETTTANGRLQVGAMPTDAALGFSGTAPLFKLTAVYPPGTPLPTAADFLISCTAYALDTSPLDTDPADGTPADVTVTLSIQTQSL